MREIMAGPTSQQYIDREKARALAPHSLQAVCSVGLNLFRALTDISSTGAAAHGRTDRALP